jgi:hypothetical protein
MTPVAMGQPRVRAMCVVEVGLFRGEVGGGPFEAGCVGAGLGEGV